jgi:hypothetical protein
MLVKALIARFCPKEEVSVFSHDVLLDWRRPLHGGGDEDRWAGWPQFEVQLLGNDKEAEMSKFWQTLSTRFSLCSALLISLLLYIGAGAWTLYFRSTSPYLAIPMALGTAVLLVPRR